ncbi:unnamed protein product, partial [Mesorhabditis spiculigera]
MSARVPVLLVLTCLLGYCLHGVAADCYQCTEGAVALIPDLYTSYFDLHGNMTISEDCKVIAETTKTCPGNKCIYAFVDSSLVGFMHIRNCAPPKYLENWETGRRVVNGSTWFHACESERCNKLQLWELKAGVMRAEDASSDSSAIFTMYPAIALLIAIMPSFF